MTVGEWIEHQSQRTLRHYPFAALLHSFGLITSVSTSARLASHTTVGRTRQRMIQGFICSHPSHMSRNDVNETQQEHWKLNTMGSFLIQPHLPTVWEASGEWHVSIDTLYTGRNQEKVRKMSKKKWPRAPLIKNIRYFPSCNLLI